MKLENKTFDELRLGDSAELRRLLTMDDLLAFATIVASFFFVGWFLYNAMPTGFIEFNDAAKADPVVKKQRKQTAPSRSAASRLPQWADGNWDRFSSRVMSLALCVAHHESWNEHNGRRLYTALNLQGSSASGFAQWIDSTWRIQARRAGVGTQYARAYLAPARIQAEVFAFQVKNFGMYPWHGTGCEGT